MLANSAAKQNDVVAYQAALERLVTYYPNKDYWTDLVRRLARKPGFDRRLQLDLFRLEGAVGALDNANELMEMTQLALAEGLPGEATAIIKRGYAAGVLGTGAEAGRQSRLRDLAARTAADDVKTLAPRERDAAAAKDGTGLVNMGLAYGGYGQADKAVALIEQGIRKGGLKHLEDAKLHLGVAYLAAGQKDQAIAMLKTVQGADGPADLARLWMIRAQQTAGL
jgi:hypothetical protein